MTFKHKLIEEFYNDEDYEDQVVSQTTKVSFSGKITDIALIDAVAARFGKTRTAILSDLINTTALQMFISLRDEDRLAISKDADLASTAMLEKKGITQTYAGVGLEDGKTSTTEDMTWRSLGAMYRDREVKDNVDS